MPVPPVASADHGIPDFSQAERVVVRRAFARQMLAIAGVENAAVAAAFAAVPREAFLGPPPWTTALPLVGYHVLSGSDPVVLYQDLVITLDPARGVNNGSPSLHARLLDALGPKPGEHIIHIGAGAGYYTALLAELVGPSGRVTAVEFDAALAERARASLCDRGNVQVIIGDGACWPQAQADGVYVNFAVARPADRWIEGLAPGGRLIFPLGVPGPRQPNLGGRHADRGAVLRIERRGEGYGARAIMPAYFVCAEGGSTEVAADELVRLRAAFDGGGIDRVRSLIWKQPAPPDCSWFASETWALCQDDTP